MKIPSKKKCYELFSKYKTPIHIIKHSEAVNKVAVIIAEKLKEKGINVDVDAVDRASLLHDFARVVDFKNTEFEKNTEKQKFYEELRTRFKNMHHADAGCKILVKEGYPEIGKIVSKHKFIVIGTEEEPKTWEEKIVYYVDKRAIDDKIVSLKERFDDLDKRYGSGKAGLIDKNIILKKQKLIFELENELFAPLDIKPEDIQ